MSDKNNLISTNHYHENSELKEWCIMNKKGYLFENEKVKQFSCVCDDKILICEECIKECHATHEFKEVNDNISIQRFICKCTHKNSIEDNFNQESQSKSCRMKGLLNKIWNYSNLFTTDKGNFCLYCHVICPKKHNTLTETSENKCNCKVNHQGWQDLVNIFSNREEFDNYLNVSQFFPNLMTYLQDKGIFINNQMNFKNPVNKNDVVDCLKILYFFGKNYDFTYCYKYLPNNFQKIFYTSLLDNKNQLTDIEYSIYILKILLHFYFVPKLKTNFHLIQVDEKISFFHRMILNENLDKELEGENQLNKEDVRYMMNHLIYYIKTCSENTENLNLIFKLILTFLDYIIFFSSLVFDYNDYEKYVDLLMEMSEIIENIKRDDIKNNILIKLNKKLETIVYSFLIKNNDNVILHKVIKKEENENLYFSYEENEKFTNKLVRILFNFNHTLITHRNEKNEVTLELNKKIKVIEILTSPNNEDSKDLYYLSNIYGEYLESFYFSEKFKEIISNYPFSFKSFEEDKKYDEILSFVNQNNQIYDNLKQSFFKKTSMEELSNDIIKFFTDILTYLTKEKSEFNEKNVFEKNHEFKRALYLKQIFLYKTGFIDLILNCWDFINKHNQYLKNSNFKDENLSEESEKNILEIIDEKIIEILKLVTTENQMIYEILLTRTYIKKIKSLNILSFYQFYIDILVKLKSMEHCVFIIPLTIEIEKDINVEDENILEDPKILLIFKLMKYINDANLDEYMSVYNKKLFNIISNLLKNPKVNEYLKEISNAESNLESKVILNIEKTTKNESNKKYKNLDFARNLIKCINNIGKDIFNLLAQKIINLGFENVLKDKDLPSKYRKTFFQFFSSYYFGNHHTIKKQIFLNELKIDKEYEENEIKNFYYVFDKETIKTRDKNDNKIGSDDKNSFSNMTDKYEFLIVQLRKFPSLLKMMNLSKIKQNPHYLLKYFSDMINIPTGNAIYKKLYLEQNLSMSDKLVLIRIIKHFIECYEIILKTCKANYINKKRKLNEFYQYNPFDLEDTYPNENTFKKKLDESLKRIQKFNSDFDTKGIYNMNIEKCLHEYKNLKYNIKDDLNVSRTYYKRDVQDEIFYDDYTKAMYEYLDKKIDPENKLIMKKIFEDEFELVYENTGIRIINCLLFGLENYESAQINEYYQSNQLNNDEMIKSKETENNSCINYNNLETLKNERNTENYNNENIDFHVSLFNSIIKLNPSKCQSKIVQNLNNQYFFKEIMTENIPFHIHSLINIFKSNLVHHFDQYVYLNLLDYIEFLRLLCENHNIYFQSFIFNYPIAIDKDAVETKENNFSSNMYEEDNQIEYGITSLELPKNNFISMLLILYSYTVKEIIEIENKQLLCECLSDITQNETLLFFESILNKITDFFVEICQGCTSYNFKETFNIENSAFYTYFETCNRIITNYQTELPLTQEKILYNFLRFMITFLEQDSNPEEQKKILLRRFNTTKLQFLLIQLMKKFYFEKVEKETKSETKITHDKDKSRIKKDGYKKILEFYIHKIENDDKEENVKENNENKENKEDKENSLHKEEKDMKDVEVQDGSELTENMDSFNKPFNEKEILLGISISIFHFIRLGSLYSKRFESTYNNLKSSADNYDPNSNTENSKREIFMFCKEIIRDVEIFLSENEEDQEARDLYKTKLNLSDEMINKSIEGNNEENKAYVKKIFFQCHPVSIMLTDRDMEKFMDKAPVEDINNKLYYFIKELPNIIDTLKFRRKLFNDKPRIYDFQKMNFKYNEIISAVFVLIINVVLTLSLNLNENLEIIGNYDLIIDFISVTHIIFLMCVVGIWYFINASTLFNYTHRRKESIDEEFNWFKKIEEYLKLLINEEIFPLMWNMIFGILAFSNNDWRFFYSIQLFTLFNLSTTMRSAVFTMQQRYSQLVATIILIIIISLFFASISFMYYQELFWSEDLNMNMCDTFYHCFLTIFNVGFIAGSVDFSTIISIQNPIYWKHFIYSWAYYFFISIIMVNIINAIIVDTFQKIRETNNEKYDTIENTCFICSNHRNDFESIGLSFKDHTTKEHKVQNYFKYLMKINLEDPYELNHVESYVLDCFENNQTTFFPIKTSLVVNEN